MPTDKISYIGGKGRGTVVRFAILFVVAILGLSLTSCCTSGPRSPKSDWHLPAITSVAHIEVQGHRGARSRFPENSLPAFDYALQVGVDTLELDMGVSKDKVVMVSHNPYIDPELCIDKNGKKLKEKIPFALLTAAEIQSFQCGTLPHPRFPNQKKVKVKIPTLREVFTLVTTSPLPLAEKVRFNIETKSFPAHPEATPAPKEFAQLVLSVVNEFGLLNRITLQSFDHRTLIEARLLEPKVVLSPLTEANWINLAAMAQDLRAEVLSPSLEWLTKSQIDDAHRVGVRVVPWTANDPTAWQALIAAGADGIISDDPESLIAFLKSKGLR